MLEGIPFGRACVIADRVASHTEDTEEEDAHIHIQMDIYSMGHRRELRRASSASPMWVCVSVRAHERDDRCGIRKMLRFCRALLFCSDCLEFNQ